MDEKKTIPEFDTDEELAEWVDTHDLSPYMDSMEEVTEKFRVIRTRSLDVRISVDYLEAIKTLAARRDISYHTLIQQWLEERLNQEAPDLAPDREYD